MRRFITLLVLLITAPAFAGPLRDSVDGGLFLKAIAGGLGLSVLAMLGVFAQARKAIEEILDVVRLVKFLVNKYKNHATSSEVRKDMESLRKELDEALEALACTVEKLRFPKAKILARRLRGAL